jgi:hypothetical protein
MKEARDFQRSKVYAWEHETFPKNEEKFTLIECHELAAKLYGARVKVKDGRGRRMACSYIRRYPTIALPKWARNEIVIAHEVAHLFFRNDLTIPAHGALWMCKYLELLGRLGLDEDRLRQSAVAYGLKVR